MIKFNFLSLSKHLNCYVLFFIKNIKCIKTTGVHVSNGLLLYDNFNSFKPNHKIENHLIFSYICKHFSIC